MNFWNLEILLHNYPNIQIIYLQQRRENYRQRSSSVRKDLAGIKRDVRAVDYSILDEKLTGAYSCVDPAVDGRQIGVAAMDYHRRSLRESDDGDVRRVRPFHHRYYAGVE